MAYISAAEVREIRNELKYRFGNKLKFSVKNDNNSKVNVAIKSGTVDFSDILKGQSHIGINEYHMTQYGSHKAIFDEIFQIIKTAPAKAENGREWFDHSDSMTDYSHTAFYIGLRVGISSDKPYKFTGRAHSKKQTQIVNDNWTTSLNPAEFGFMPLDATDDEQNNIFAHIVKTPEAHEILKKNYAITVTPFSSEIRNLLEANGVDYAVTDATPIEDMTLDGVSLGVHQIVIDSHDLDRVLHIVKEEKSLVSSETMDLPDPEDLIGFR